MYYLDIIPAMCFLISHQPFAEYMAYALVQNYSTNNPDNPEVDNGDEQIYRKMHTADWCWIVQQVFIDLWA